jgi:hypothetical protein
LRTHRIAGAIIGLPNWHSHASTRMPQSNSQNR